MKMRQNRYRIWTKAAALSMAAIMAVSMAGCGKGTDNADAGDNKKNETSADKAQGVDGYVYVPTYEKVSQEQNGNIGNSFINGDYLYFTVWSYDEETGESSQTFNRRKLEENSQMETLPITVTEEENSYVSEMIPDSAGNYWLLMVSYSEEVTEQGNTKSYYTLVKYDSQGNETARQDISSAVGEDGYIQYSVIDKDGHLYLSSDSKILLFDENGIPAGEVSSAGSWINCMGCGKDGKVYFTGYDDQGNMTLTEINYDTKSTGSSYKNFPTQNQSGLLTPGVEKDFLVNTGSSVYEYDLATQTATKLFDWLDSDINGQYVNMIAALSDGRIIACINDWESDDGNELAYLTKTPSSEVAERQVITLGCMYQSQDTQNLAVKFNKSNDKYRISIKTYIDENNWTETSYSDGQAALNSELASGNGPDLFDLSGINMENLIAKGLIEDLNPYLESSEKVKKEDLVENVLNAYEMDGILVGIPGTFSIQTILGKTKLVGDKMGWSIQDMMDFIDAHPDQTAFEYANKSVMLEYGMMFNQEAFIDWENADCHFDSEEFKTLLAYVNKFPDEVDYSDEGPSLPNRLASEDVLLNSATISEPSDFFMERAVFGGDEVTCIGFPTVDGSVANVLRAGNSLYAISSKSSCKDGAWAFIESMLTAESYEAGSYYMYGFPTRKDALDKVYKEAMDIEYVKDENGEIMKDENGEPMKERKTGMGWDDFYVDYCGSTQEEIDELQALIDSARPGDTTDEEISNIINEEADAYFKGQKSVDEVADIIQSRVKIYISENS